MTTGSRSIKNSPSLASAPLDRLGEVVSELEQAQVDYIHFDVEDGSFISMMIQQLVNKLIQNPNLLTSLTAAKDPKQAFNLIISSVAKEP